jgi:putative oxidoreductase
MLRFAVALSLTGVAQTATGFSDAESLFTRCLPGVTAIFICVGLWTPLAAVIAVAIQTIAIILAQQLNSSLLAPSIAALSLAMLGPGAWSIDARLFGRKRIL